jgi:hypothetical protein
MKKREKSDLSSVRNSLENLTKKNKKKKSEFRTARRHQKSKNKN